MATLEQTVQNMWGELRENLRRPRELYSHLHAGARSEEMTALLLETAKELENAIEGGVQEVKRRRLNVLYAELEEAEFSSEVFKRLDELARLASVVILLIGLQRAFLAGELELSGEGAESSDQDGSCAEGKDLKEIIAEIQKFIARDPGAKAHPAIKTILILLQRYRREADTFRKLREQSTGHRLEMYTRTFTRTFKDILASIQRNYEAYLAETRGETAVEKRPSPLANLDTGKWAAVLVKEAEEASRMRATLLFLTGEHSNLRGPVVTLARRRPLMGELLERENAVGAQCTGSESAAMRLNRLIGREAATWLRTRASRRAAAGRAGCR